MHHKISVKNLCSLHSCIGDNFVLEEKDLPPNNCDSMGYEIGPSKEGWSLIDLANLVGWHLWSTHPSKLDGEDAY